jgi:hypothetical protein
VSESHTVILDADDLALLRELGMATGRVRTMWIQSTLEAELERLAREGRE